MPPVSDRRRATTDALAVPRPIDAEDRAGEATDPDWPVPTETDRPHTGHLCTTVAQLASLNLAVSGGYTSAADLLPVVLVIGA